MNKSIDINGYRITKDSKPWIIAEMSANHNGSKEKAFEIIRKAKECGANAVKIQTYKADTITLNSHRDEFKIKGGLWDGENLYNLYAKAFTPWEWHKDLFAYAQDLGITLFSSPFDFTAVDLLEDLNCPVYKIASFEMVDIPLIRRVAQTHKPIIMSTGMATPEEIALAVETIKRENNHDIILLHCTSGYPTPAENSDLNTIPWLAEEFQVLAGLSDHSLGTEVPFVATALGAVVIEKHFKVDDKSGADEAFSLNPVELQELCEKTQLAHTLMGKIRTETAEAEKQSLKFRRSLYLVKDIKKGEPFTTEHIRSVRPNNGLAPKYYDQILNTTASKDLISDSGIPLEASMLEDMLEDELKSI